MYLVSACLAGLNTRYDATSCPSEKVRRLVEDGMAIPVCPEQLGGLPTPRPAVELAGGDGFDVLDGLARAVTVEGAKDRTEAFLKGARQTLKIALLHGVTEAVLKDGSPSCGVNFVHSDGGKIKGMGVAAALLRRHGIRVISDDSL